MALQQAYRKLYPQTYEAWESRPNLSGAVTWVAGATRGAGRAMAVELGRAGAKVFVSGRSTRAKPHEGPRQETIEATAEAVSEAGGIGVALVVDHTDEKAVREAAARVGEECGGKLDLLVNNVWGGDSSMEWDKKLWELDLGKAMRLIHNSVDSHLITAAAALPLLIAKGKGGLLVEVTDGADSSWRHQFVYDHVKMTLTRMTFGLSMETHGTGVQVVGLSPGFLRSEAMFDHFGVTEANWKDAIEKDAGFEGSETPHYVGRGLVYLTGLARTDEGLGARAGRVHASWNLAKEGDFNDIDGTRPYWPDTLAKLGITPSFPK